MIPETLQALKKFGPSLSLGRRSCFAVHGTDSIPRRSPGLNCGGCGCIFAGPDLHWCIGCAVSSRCQPGMMRVLSLLWLRMSGIGKSAGSGCFEALAGGVMPARAAVCPRGRLRTRGAENEPVRRFRTGGLNLGGPGRRFDARCRAAGQSGCGWGGGYLLYP